MWLVLAHRHAPFWLGRELSTAVGSELDLVDRKLQAETALLAKGTSQLNGRGLAA